MGRVVDVSLLLPLTDRAAPLAAPSAVHPGAWQLGERLDAWARGRGLVLGDPDTTPLGRAHCERMAARAFPAAELDRVELFARWLTWTFALDDTVDRAPFAGSATAVYGLYDELLGAVRRGRARPGARPLEAALAELWLLTTPGTSRDWRRRFLQHMEDHRAACAEEAVRRRVGRRLTPEGYAFARRRACGPFLYDLVEPVLGVEMPARVLGTPAWKLVSEGTADVVAWSNDVVSYGLEAARGDVHNLVGVIAAARGVEAEQAARLVVDRIAARAADVQAEVAAFPETLGHLRLTEEQRTAATRVVAVLLDTPRAHLEWLAESGRYAGGVPEDPDRARRLDALASLR